MNNSRGSLLGLTAVLVGCLSSPGQFFTISPGGSTPGYLSDTVYVPGGPPPLTGPGAAPVLPGPPPPLPPGFYILNGLSSGWDAGSVYQFSVTAASLGAPFSPVFVQATAGTAPSQFFGGLPAGPLPPEHAGDLFVVVGLPTFGLPALAPPPAFPTGFIDEFTLGLNVGPGAQDNLNAVTFRPPSPAGFYYSLALGGLGAYAGSPADILTPTGLWAPSLALGLDTAGFGSDDIDALIIHDLGIFGVYEPGIDFVAFSLTPGSATLGLLGYAPGTGGADLFFPPVGPGLPGLFLPSGVFGLLPTDNIDAIDVVPEPTVACLVGTALAVGLLRRRPTPA
jgi:hypothetical protein